jgi:hypothetical protein
LYEHGFVRANKPFVHNYILGLGGREIKTGDLLEALRTSCKHSVEKFQATKWIGLKI